MAYQKVTNLHRMNPKNYANASNKDSYRDQIPETADSPNAALARLAQADHT